MVEAIFGGTYPSHATGNTTLISSWIKVPRDSGTCTRCPMECRLSSAPEWLCRISIRREFDATGKRLTDVSEDPFGDPITDKEEVEVMLRRAHVAVLQPGIQVAEILKMNVEELKEKIVDGKAPSFSRNVVCVDLEGI